MVRVLSVMLLVVGCVVTDRDACVDDPAAAACADAAPSDAPLDASPEAEA